MEKFINFIYDYLFKSRSEISEGKFAAKLINTKIEKMQKNNVSDLDNLIEKRYYKKLLAQIKNLLNINSFKNHKILEMGSGSGVLSLYMMREGAKVTLLDSSKIALDYSLMMYRTLKQKKGGGEADFICQDIFHKLSSEEKFDVIHNSGVIEHYDFLKAREIVRAMKENTKKNGYVIVAVPNYFCPNLIFTWAKYRKGTEQFYSKNKLRKIIEESGLKFIKIETSTFVYPDWVPRFITQKSQKIESFLGKYLNLGFLYIGVGRNGSC